MTRDTSNVEFSDVIMMASRCMSVCACGVACVCKEGVDDDGDDGSSLPAVEGKIYASLLLY